MIHEKPLWWRLYFNPVYTETARAVGYAGCTYRELTQKIEQLAQRFDQRLVESAVYHLTVFEGQMTVNPKPLAKVQLRQQVRTLCWQLLGPPPEHPEYAHFQQGDPWVQPRERRPTEPPSDPEKPTRKKK